MSIIRRMPCALRIVVGIVFILGTLVAIFIVLPDETVQEPRTLVSNLDRDAGKVTVSVKGKFTVPIKSNIPESLTGHEILEQSKGKCLGTFCITYYCPCKKCNGNTTGLCANGNQMIPYNTIAVDPSVIPLGSSVYIEGYGMLNAYDTGGGVNGYHIDILCQTHEEAIANGVKYLEVYELS